MKTKRTGDCTGDDYGIPLNRYKELKAFCMQYSRKKDIRSRRMIEEAAVRASPGLWKYILKSVTRDLPYEYVTYDKELGRIPAGESEFYAYRRLFYYYLDKSLAAGKHK